jgi:hypothetical protein
VRYDVEDDIDALNGPYNYTKQKTLALGASAIDYLLTTVFSGLRQVMAHDRFLSFDFYFLYSSAISLSVPR